MNAAVLHRRDSLREAGGPVTESLEVRQLFSNFLAANGLLSVSATTYPDVITITSNGVTVRVTEQVVGQAPVTTAWRAEKVTSLAISGREGNDSISNRTNIYSQIDAGAGDDLVHGGYTRDIIYGREGNDTIYGYSGDDYIDAASGNNFVHGNEGNDQIWGYYGIDTLCGGDGNDYIRTWSGNDILYGDAGNDSLIAGAGEDSIIGGPGADLMWGEDGNDRLVGGTASDRDPDGYIGGGGYDTFVTHWVWFADGGGYWQNVSRVYDFQNYDYGWGIDTWVNP